MAYLAFRPIEHEDTHPFLASEQAIEDARSDESSCASEQDARGMMTSTTGRSDKRNVN